MGWNGEVVDSNNGGDINEFSSCERTFLTNADKQGANTTVTYMTTAFNIEQHKQFYCGFANNVLWPLLHEQTDVISQAPDDYAGYQAVNLLFARQLKKIIQPDDVIWVHDYHFLSVAYYCCQLGISNRIGFFLHIPFVPLPFWQQLDKSPELINHLAHYDVFGTQTQQDKTNCAAVFQHYLKDSFLNNLPLAAFCTKPDSGKAGTRLMLNIDSGIPHCLVINAYPIGVNATRIQQHVMSLSFHLSSHSVRNIQGEIGTALAVTRQYFYYVSHLIDTEPQRSHELVIRELRSQVEKVARLVMESIGQALGAAPFCSNAHFARLSVDLTVFIRQSHGAFDLQKIGELSSDVTRDLTDKQVNIWQL